MPKSVCPKFYIWKIELFFFLEKTPGDVKFQYFKIETTILKKLIFQIQFLDTFMNSHFFYEKNLLALDM